MSSTVAKVIPTKVSPQIAGRDKSTNASTYECFFESFYKCDVFVVDWKPDHEILLAFHLSEGRLPRLEITL